MHISLARPRQSVGRSDCSQDISRAGLLGWLAQLVSSAQPSAWIPSIVRLQVLCSAAPSSQCSRSETRGRIVSSLCLLSARFVPTPHLSHSLHLLSFLVVPFTRGPGHGYVFSRDPRVTHRSHPEKRAHAGTQRRSGGPASRYLLACRLHLPLRPPLYLYRVIPKSVARHLAASASSAFTARLAPS